MNLYYNNGIIKTQRGHGMRIIIVGCGKVGDLLTSYISAEGHDVIVVDADQAIIENVVNQYDVLGVVGNGASNSVQMEAGADKANLLIAVTASDELNIMCCMVARKLGTRHTIARVRNPEYSEQIVFMRSEFGLSMAVNPEYSAAQEIQRIIRFPAALKVDTFCKGRVDLVEVKIGNEHPLCGRKLSELVLVCGVNVLVCAVKRGDEVIIPRGDFTPEAGDVIHITASHADLVSFFKKLGISDKRIRSVMILGGGKIAYFLARRLESLGIDVKLVERDRERAEQLAELLPRSMIIHGDAADSDLLDEEGIADMDAAVTLTGVDEENIMISLYASKCGVDKVITKINRPGIMKLLSSIGLECVVSPKAITANSILRYIRGLEHSDSSSIETLYKIVDGKVEAIEFVAADGFDDLGKPIKTMKIRRDIIIACIIRGSKVIYPHGDDTIEKGDTVIVVAKSEQAVHDLDDILENPVK